MEVGDLVLGFALLYISDTISDSAIIEGFLGTWQLHIRQMNIKFREDAIYAPSAPAQQMMRLESAEQRFPLAQREAGASLGSAAQVAFQRRTLEPELLA